MDNSQLMIIAMADQCEQIIRDTKKVNPAFPDSLQPNHLLWMCARIHHSAESWPLARLNRWLGFIQAAMIAQGMIDLNSAKSMFDKAKVAHADPGEDWIDHLDPSSHYAMDLGGQG
jgi:hypothetical protein